MWFIGFEVEQETSAPPPKKTPGSAPDYHHHQALRLFTINVFNLSDQKALTRNINKLKKNVKQSYEIKITLRGFEAFSKIALRRMNI